MASKTNLVSVAALLATLWAVLATSTPRDSFRYGTYHVTSDCVSPMIEEDIEVDNMEIISPPGRTFGDFGFPQNQIALDATISGEMNGVSRSCTRTYGSVDDDHSEYVYNCFDDGTLACTILIE
jgi:hypothetical protein